MLRETWSFQFCNINFLGMCIWAGVLADVTETGSSVNCACDSLGRSSDAVIVSFPLWHSITLKWTASRFFSVSSSESPASVLSF